MAEVIDIVKTLESKKKVLKGYKLQAEETKNSRIRNEAKLEHLKKSEDDIVLKIKNLGYDPDNLKAHMEAKIKDLNSITDKLEMVMPDEYGVIPANAKQILNIAPSEEIVEEKKVVVESTINLDDIDFDDLPI